MNEFWSIFQAQRTKKAKHHCMEPLNKIGLEKFQRWLDYFINYSISYNNYNLFKAFSVMKDFLKKFSWNIRLQNLLPHKDYLKISL